MLDKFLLTPLLDNDVLTRELGDAEARLLVEWLVDEAERRAGELSQAEAELEISGLLLWARGIVKFIHLWCYQEARAAAIQLAASERFSWPLPTAWMEPFELLEQILYWQEQANAMTQARQMPTQVLRGAA